MWRSELNHPIGSLVDFKDLFTQRLFNKFLPKFSKRYDEEFFLAY